MPIIATAAWSINAKQAMHFPREGSVLQRYAAVFPGVEVNSTFYGHHKPETYARWADSVPPTFRFALKLPQSITHEQRLKGCQALFEAFLSEIAPLGPKVGPLLCQLPPSLAFDAQTVRSALSMMRGLHAGPIVVEARHASWRAEEVWPCSRISASNACSPIPRRCGRRRVFPARPPMSACTARRRSTIPSMRTTL